MGEYLVTKISVSFVSFLSNLNYKQIDLNKVYHMFMYNYNTIFTGRRSHISRACFHAGPPPGKGITVAHKCFLY